MNGIWERSMQPYEGLSPYERVKKVAQEILGSVPDPLALLPQEKNAEIIFFAQIVNGIDYDYYAWCAFKARNEAPAYLMTPPTTLNTIFQEYIQTADSVQKARFSQETLDELAAAVHGIGLETIVLKHVPLKQKANGRRYVGLCPFHEERSPSFNVLPRKKRWKCYGCGSSGGAIDFIKKIKAVSFDKAVNILAKQFGIPVKYKEESKSE